VDEQKRNRDKSKSRKSGIKRTAADLVLEVHSKEIRRLEKRIKVLETKCHSFDELSGRVKLQEHSLHRIAELLRVHSSFGI